MKPLWYHPTARAEVGSAHDWYLRQSIEAADGFYEELIPAIDRIHERPASFPKYIYGTQRLVLQRYPYSIVFRERLHDVQIIAIAHAKRREGYWSKRTKQ